VISLEAFYDRSPGWVQTVMLNAYAAKIHRQRYGRRFEEVEVELEGTQHLSKERIEAYQSRLLARLIEHAYGTVPYYRKLFDAHGVAPGDIRSAADLPRIPVLTKEIVKRNAEALISRAASRDRLTVGRTSGTTGSPLTVYWDDETCIYANALDWRQKRWAGVTPGDRLAVIFGRKVVSLDRKTPPFWRMDYVHNHLWMSAFHMREDNLSLYAEKLSDFAPDAIEAYPSAAALLARHLVRAGRRMKLSAVFTTSETLLPAQREIIEEAFSCRVFDYLGMAERVVFATECDSHDGRHLCFELAVNEIVDGRGNPVPEGEPGYIAGTSLRNYGMPLIRYRTDDVTSLSTERCPCGRSMPLIRAVTTKSEDMIVTPDGKILPPAVMTHPFKPIKAIRESQIIQEDLRHMTVRIVRDGDYTDEDTARLLSAIRERVGEGMKIEVEFLEGIPRNAAGKYRWVISRVPPPL
jgi:phenylacetate-CoA ligase